MIWGVLRLMLGLAVMVGAVAMACNPDPRYADIPSYQETSGGAWAFLFLIGLGLFFTAGDDR